MSINPTDLLAENAYIEVQDYLLHRGNPLTDEEWPAVQALGFDLVGAAMRFVQTYGLSNGFVLGLKSDLARTGSLSVRQMRGALNVLQQHLHRGTIKLARRDGEAPKMGIVAAPAPLVVEVAAPEGSEFKTTEHNYKCYGCNKYFRTFEDVMRHKTVEHGYVGKATTEPTEMVPVIKAAPKSHLDLSSLPDGRYACINPKDGKQYVFLMVKTIKKRTYRNRRFRFGRIITGSEWIEAGTREVREWSTDSKRLCGQQKPGEGYEGEYMDELVAVMMAPEAWAKVFAMFIGCCFRCSRTLTDDDSRSKGYGPECAKYIEASGYWKKYLPTSAPVPAPAPAAPVVTAPAPKPVEAQCFFCKASITGSAYRVAGTLATVNACKVCYEDSLLEDADESSPQPTECFHTPDDCICDEPF